jgi:hypothetical protein
MNKLIQENPPTHIWVQSWSSDGNGEHLPSDPAILQEIDDWTGQLFNYYFLSHFSDSIKGNLDVNHQNYDTLKEKLDLFFEDGELTSIHSRLVEKWQEATGLGDEDALWFTVHWEQFSIEDYHGPAIGFYFGREKGNFLGFSNGEPAVFQGLPMKKPEYGCLILPDPTDGFQVYILEPGKAEGVGTSWSNFLFPFFQYADDAFHARQFFKMVKNFSEDVLIKEQNQPKEKQIAFLSESLDFASENKGVNLNSFKNEVIKEASIKDAFEDYQQKYSEGRRWNPPDQFAMTEKVQDQAKKFVRSVIKLDKNFHLYVHGRRDRIEQGYDEEKRMNFYKLWYESET